MFFLHGALQLNDINGEPYTPLVLHDHPAAVFIFVGVDCPISNSYTPELKKIIQNYSARNLDFFIVYSDSTLIPADAKKHSDDFGYPCPSLLDRDQRLMKKLHATVTPEAVVVGSAGEVLYQGRIDNWYQDFGQQRFVATQHDLRNALDAILAGKKVAVPVTKAVGCPI